jgi:hypothetical protein
MNDKELEDYLMARVYNLSAEARRRHDAARYQLRRRIWLRGLIKKARAADASDEEIIFVCTKKKMERDQKDLDTALLGIILSGKSPTVEYE